MNKKILESINSGLISRERVAQIVFGLSSTREDISIWFSDRWDNYEEFNSSDAIARVPLNHYLDAFDELLPGKPVSENKYKGSQAPMTTMKRKLHFQDSELNRVFENLYFEPILILQKAIKGLVARQKLGEFRKIVGFMAQGISSSGYADAVAFYHPDGALDLLPIQERRDSSSIYSYGVLTSTGVTMFYPEGEKDSLESFEEDEEFKDDLEMEAEDDADFDEDADLELDAELEEEDNENSAENSKKELDEASKVIQISEKPQKPKSQPWKSYQFAAMNSLDLGEADDFDTITFKTPDEVYEVKLCHGHCHDEWGGVSQDQVDAQLLAHFKNHSHLIKPESKESEFPVSYDASAVSAWSVGKFYGQKSNVITKLIEGNQPNLAIDFWTHLPLDDDDKFSLGGKLLGELVQPTTLNLALKVLESFEAISEKFDESDLEKILEYRLRIYCSLERYAEVLKIKTSETFKSKKKVSEDIIAYFALALSKTGQSQEGLNLLQTLPVEDRKSALPRWTEAVCTYGVGVKSLAVTRFEESVNKDRDQMVWYEIDFKNCDVLLTAAENNQMLFNKKNEDGKLAARSIRYEQPAISDFDLNSKFQKSVLYSPGSESYEWQKSENFVTVKKSVRKIITSETGNYWGVTDKGVFSIKVVGNTVECGDIVELSEGNLNDCFCNGRWLYAVNASYVFTYDTSKGGKPVLVSQVPSFDRYGQNIYLAKNLKSSDFPDSHVDCLIVSGNDGASVYELSQPQKPKLLSTIGIGYGRDLNRSFGKQVLVKNNFLYFVCAGAGLMIFDLSNAKEPKFRSALACLVPDQKESCFFDGEIAIDGNTAMLTSNDLTWFVDIADPDSPKTKQLLNIPDSPFECVKMNSVNGTIFSHAPDATALLEIKFESELIVKSVIPIYDTQEPTAEVEFKDCGVLVNQNLWLAAVDEEVILFQRKAVPGLVLEEIAQWESKVTELTEWLKTCLNEVAAQNLKLGLLAVNCENNYIQVLMAPPQTCSFATKIPHGLKLFSGRDEMLLFDKQLKFENTAEEIEENKIRAIVRKQAKNYAMAEALDSVLKNILEAPELKTCSSGRVYLIASGHIYSGLRKGSGIVGVFLNPDQEWKPYRLTPTDKTAPDLAQLLSNFRHWDSLKARLPKDSELRAGLRDLAAAGNADAVRLLSWALSFDQDELVKSLFKALEHANSKLLAIDALGGLVDRKDVHERLSQIWNGLPKSGFVLSHSNWQEIKPEAEVAISLSTPLNFADDSIMHNLVCEILSSDRIDYYGYDMVEKIIKEMSDTSVVQLRPVLEIG